MGSLVGGARPKTITAYNEKTCQIRSKPALADKDEHSLIKFNEISDIQFGASKGNRRIEMT